MIKMHMLYFDILGYDIEIFLGGNRSYVFFMRGFGCAFFNFKNKSGGIDMDHETEIFKRANLQKIREFLLMGAEQLDQLSGTYDEELRKATEKMRNKIRKYLKDRETEDIEKEEDNAMNYIFEFADVYEKVYMEIGIKCGIKLAKELKI